MPDPASSLPSHPPVFASPSSTRTQDAQASSRSVKHEEPTPSSLSPEAPKSSAQPDSAQPANSSNFRSERRSEAVDEAGVLSANSPVSAAMLAGGDGPAPSEPKTATTTGLDTATIAASDSLPSRAERADPVTQSDSAVKVEVPDAKGHGADLKAEGGVPTTLADLSNFSPPSLPPAPAPAPAAAPSTSSPPPAAPPEPAAPAAAPTLTPARLLTTPPTTLLTTIKDRGDFDLHRSSLEKAFLSSPLASQLSTHLTALLTERLTAERASLPDRNPRIQQQRLSAFVERERVVAQFVQRVVEDDEAILGKHGVVGREVWRLVREMVAGLEREEERGKTHGREVEDQRRVEGDVDADADMEVDG